MKLYSLIEVMHKLGITQKTAYRWIEQNWLTPTYERKGAKGKTMRLFSDEDIRRAWHLAGAELDRPVGGPGGPRLVSVAELGVAESTNDLPDVESVLPHEPGWIDVVGEN